MTAADTTRPAGQSTDTGPAHDTPTTAPASFGAELFRGSLRIELLEMPPAEPRRLDEDAERFLARLHRFCETGIDGRRIEREDRIPDQVIEGLKDLGAFCIKIGREHGGLGLSGVCYHRALMIVSSVHPSLGELLAAHQAIGLPQPIALFGTPEQQREFLPRCVREISAFTLTEADIGNDPYRMHTTAVADPAAGTYTVDGVKLWATNGVLADLLVVMALVPASDHGPGGMTAFVIDADTAGVTVEHRSSFLGLRGLENGVIRLHHVVVPARNRIGEEGAGLDIALAAQDTGRLSLPAVCAAAAKWSLKIAREWAGARVQWGRPIGEHDAVAGKVAFIAATAFALEAMVEVTGRRADLATTDTRVEAELAKLFASEKTWTVADELVQLRGGRGYETAESAVARGERGVPVEQLLRDLRIGRIFDSSSEVLRVFLAQTVLDGHRRGIRPSTVMDDDPAATENRRGGPLAEHLRYVERAAHRLSALIDQATGRPDSELDGGELDGGELDERQRHLGRIVDIGAELYAMSASCVYAAARSDHPDAAAELADAFCAQARCRVEELFARLSDNTDAVDRGLARRVFADRFTWLEQGILDSSVEGPWVAEPKPGPATGANLRRVVPADRPHPRSRRDDRSAR